MVLLVVVAAGETLDAQSTQELVADPQVLGAITQTRTGTRDFGFEIGPGDAHEDSRLAHGEADRAAIIFSEVSCPIKGSALVVDGCPVTASGTDLFGAQELLRSSALSDGK
jgi:hypothetical protein